MITPHIWPTIWYFHTPICHMKSTPLNPTWLPLISYPYETYKSQLLMIIPHNPPIWFIHITHPYVIPSYTTIRLLHIQTTAWFPYYNTHPHVYPTYHTHMKSSNHMPTWFLYIITPNEISIYITHMNNPKIISSKDTGLRQQAYQCPPVISIHHTSPA